MNIIKRSAIFLVALICLFCGTLAQSVRADSAAMAGWDSHWQFLIGTWVGKGDGAVGKGGGEFTFAYDLGAQIIVRKNHSEYPGSATHPAVSHDDLMIVYVDPQDKSVHADYYDGFHTIRYATSISDDGKTLYLTSPVVNGQPRYRLTYTKLTENSLSSAFQIAPPGKTDEFHTYVEGTCVRQVAGKSK